MITRKSCTLRMSFPDPDPQKWRTSVVCDTIAATELIARDFTNFERVLVHIPTGTDLRYPDKPRNRAEELLRRLRRPFPVYIFKHIYERALGPGRVMRGSNDDGVVVMQYQPREYEKMIRAEEAKSLERRQIIRPEEAGILYEID